ncbi:hypothetical protein pb186bvf_015147 [Paramecium bursaria]
MFKHSGQAETKAYIEISPKQLSINITQIVDIVILLERGDRKIQTQPVKLENGFAEFNQVLRLPATLYFDTKKKIYDEKKGRLLVLVKYDKGLKQAGVINVDFADYLNQRMAQKSEKISLQDCPDKKAYLSFDVNFVSQEVQKEVNRSKTPEAAISQIKEQQIRQQIINLQQENLKLKNQLQQPDETPTKVECELCIQFQKVNAELQEKIRLTNEKVIELKRERQSQQPSSLILKEEQQHQELLQQIQLVKKQNQEYTIKIKQLQDELLEQKRPDQSLNIVTQELREKLEDQMLSLTTYKKENSDLKAKLKILNEQLIDSRQRIADLEHETEKLQQDDPQQQKYLDELQDTIAKYKIDIEHKVNENSILVREKQQIEERLDNLSVQYDDLERQLLKAKQRYACVMHEFLCQGNSDVIEVLEKYSQDQ